MFFSKISTHFGMPPIWRWRNLNSHVPFFHISLIRINNISNIQYIFQFLTPPSVLETLYKLFIFEWYIIYDWSKTTTLSLNLASVFLFVFLQTANPNLCWDRTPKITHKLTRRTNLAPSPSPPLWTAFCNKVLLQLVKVAGSNKV